MLLSRVSIPLIALFILVIAGCMLYLLDAHNIFRAHFPRLFSTVIATENNSTISSFIYDVAQQKNSIESNFAKENSDFFTREKTPVNGATEQDASGSNADTTSDKSTTRQTQSPAKNNSFFSGSYGAENDIVYTRGSEIRTLWQIYSQRIPLLYSAPLNDGTQDNLARIAQISAELDQLHFSDKSAWLIRLSQVRGDLIEYAVGGEREGTRALSFQYAQSSVDETVDALAWAMIANAIAENNYYLYICFEDMSSRCTENVFNKASEQAQTAVHDYGFTLRKKR